MKITEALMAEHMVFHNLFDHIEKAAPALETLGEVKAIAALISSALQAHSKTEDELFMGPLEPSFEQIGHREAFHEEHDLIDANLAQLQESRSIDKARGMLIATIVLCRSHFDKEERIVFPMAEQALKSKTLQELGKIWMNQRNQAAV